MPISRAEAIGAISDRSDDRYGLLSNNVRGVALVWDAVTQPGATLGLRVGGSFMQRKAELPGGRICDRPILREIAQSCGHLADTLGVEPVTDDSGYSAFAIRLMAASEKNSMRTPKT